MPVTGCDDAQVVVQASCNSACARVLLILHAARQAAVQGPHAVLSSVGPAALLHYGPGLIPALWVEAES